VTLSRSGQPSITSSSTWSSSGVLRCCWTDTVAVEVCAVASRIRHSSLARKLSPPPSQEGAVPPPPPPTPSAGAAAAASPAALLALSPAAALGGGRDTGSMPSAILRQFSVLCCACTIPITQAGSAAAIAAKVGFTIFRWKLSCTSHTHTHTHTHSTSQQSAAQVQLSAALRACWRTARVTSRAEPRQDSDVAAPATALMAHEHDLTWCELV
jgi:hypothetical protein